MKRGVIRICILLMFFPSMAIAMEAVHHDLSITLNPAERRLGVVDKITLPQEHPNKIEFPLHKGLHPKSTTPGIVLVKVRDAAGPVPLEVFTISVPSRLRTLVLEYGGVIYQPLDESGGKQARGFTETPGQISEEGVYLAGGAFWYPQFNAEPGGFSLEVHAPATWSAISQGERTMNTRTGTASVVRWESPEPQEEIYLIAAPFYEYARPASRPEPMVFLRKQEPDLAEKYLEATENYLGMYSNLIGPYPYSKFALVENFWETGLGMPSFTLLGPKVVRLPFIINTSYPHEILHNWWGNSVFPDLRKGNWSEGLTAYLSDHLMKEQQGNGAEYRLSTLQKYADYVLGNRDFPLSRFTSRHSSSSEAIGYGKALMFFHQLRRELGDDTFKLGLRDFYVKYRFRAASFDDLRTSFEFVSGKDLHNEFEQWVARAGAPQVRVRNAKAAPAQNGFVLSAILEQTQPEEAYVLNVPVAVTLEGQKQAFQTVIEMRKKRMEIKLPLSGRPVRIDIDPEFDMIRRLDREETPPAISQALGAKKMLIVLPASARKEMLAAYRKLAADLGGSGPDEVDVKLDVDVQTLPGDRAVTLLGWENRFLPEMITAISDYPVLISGNFVRISQTELGRAGHSFVLTTRLLKNKDMALTLIASDTDGPLPGLGQKLPHYHKYSYLAFEGNEPANVAKGRWPVLNSPLTLFIPTADRKTGKTDMGALAPREPLASLSPVFSKERMLETVSYLSSDDLQGRGIGTPELDRAAVYIERKFLEAGLVPAGDGQSYSQFWTDPQSGAPLSNIIGVIPGTKTELSGQSVVVGAHYDHLGRGLASARAADRGKIHPGADDNASGVAVLLELAQVLKKNLRPDRSIVFIAFSGEEAGKIGSKYYVANEKLYPVAKCIGMVNLDTVGRLGKNKLLILSAGSAREWVHIFRGAGFVTGVEIETVSEELDASDQTSFTDVGVPAVQLFSGPNLDYHRPTDTADKVDSAGLTVVASVAKEAIEYLAQRPDALTASGVHPGHAGPAAAADRKVSLGTIPDFAYQGQGCRISGVTPGSPAEGAGLREGDVIVRLNTISISGLKDLSNALKTLNPGDKVTIGFLRNGAAMTAEAVLSAR